MSVRRRKDRDKFESSLMIGGRRVRRLFDTKRQAEDFEVSMALKGRGLVPNFEATPITEAFKKYHDLESRSKDADTFVNERRYLRIAGLYLQMEGLDYIHEVTPLHVDGLSHWLLKPHDLNYLSTEGKRVSEKFLGLKPSTVNRWFATYRHAFKTFKKWKFTPENPCEFFSTLVEGKVVRGRWSRESVRLVFKASPRWFRPIFRAMYYYGLRPSSIERMTWDAVDFMKHTLTFDTKKGSKRGVVKVVTLPLLKPMERELLKLKRAFPLVRDGAVFRDDRGFKVTADRISKTGSRIIRSLGLDLDLYELKHTLADDLRMAGVTIDQVGDVFGHADDRATRKYSNNLPTDHVARSLALVRARAGQ